MTVYPNSIRFICIYGGDILKDITIEKAKEADLGKVTKILNAVTSDLISKHIYQWEYPWEEKVLKKDIQDGKIFLVLVEGHPVGTFSLQELVNEENEFYKNVTGKYLFRIAVLPRLHGLGYGHQILEEIKEKYKSSKESIYLDCWSGNEKLKKFYINVGLKYVGDYPEKDYFISIFKIY